MMLHLIGQKIFIKSQNFMSEISEKINIFQLNKLYYYLFRYCSLLYFISLLKLYYVQCEVILLNHPKTQKLYNRYLEYSMLEFEFSHSFTC